MIYIFKNCDRTVIRSRAYFNKKFTICIFFEKPVVNMEISENYDFSDINFNFDRNIQ